MDTKRNLVDLCGTVLTEPTVDHIVFGLPMYQFHLAVTRLSGVEDELVIQCAENKLPIEPNKMVGKRVRLEGRLRSYNKHVDKKSKLLLYVLVNEMVITDEGAKTANNLELSGYLCRKPVLRRISSGKSICDIMIAVPKTARSSKNYIPAICWGVVAQEIAEREAGDFVSIKGRLQSRGYTKSEESGVSEHTTYEVSVYTCIAVPKEDSEKIATEVEE